METKFFVDTADTDAIKRIFDRLSKTSSRKEVVGITTNPNAMNKVNAQNMVDFEKRVAEISLLLSQFRGDSEGVVYVQYPFSEVDPETLRVWAKLVSLMGGDHANVGLKIPPVAKILRDVEWLSSIMDINVTGVADCSTALQCLSYDVRYVSVIPGRMEEAAVNANEHLKYLNQRKRHRLPYGGPFSEIITGSMRTLKGLSDSILYGTVPTIGPKVFDLIFDGNIETFRAMWNQEDTSADLVYSPTVTPIMTGLSQTFFRQMDEAGQQLYTSLQVNNG